MSGYFTRLLIRAEGKASQVRSQSTLPFNTASISAAPLALDDPLAWQGPSDATPVTSTSAPPSADLSFSNSSPPAPAVASMSETTSQTSGDVDATTFLGTPGRRRSRDAGGQRTPDARPDPQESAKTAPVLVPDQRRGGIRVDGAHSDGRHTHVRTAPSDNALESRDFRLMEDTPHASRRSRVDAPQLDPVGGTLAKWQEPFEGVAAPSEVHVTIGRIEVTALHAPPPAAPAMRERRPPMSLDEYLSRRQRGRA